LLKDGEEQANEKWRYYTERTGLTLFAELRSDLNGTSELTERIPVIRGTIAGLNSDKALRCEVFEALIERIKNLFGPFNDAELEKMHMGQVPNNTTSISLTRELRKFGRKQAEWNTNLLKRFLPNVSTQYPLALYGRGPSWLYGVLALHAGTQQPFHQFDPRFKKGWIQALKLETSDTFEISQGAITLEQHVHKDTWMLTVLLKIGYIDYELDMQQLVFPKPPAGYGVIIDGKLPLWLFTSLARLYAGLEVPWIAFNDANTDQTDRAFVIYSKVPQYYSIGSRVPLLA
ncbi:MAG TPA: CRISPR-associated protein Csx3, partial [Ktedonobacteraceae bacterium]